MYFGLLLTFKLYNIFFPFFLRLSKGASLGAYLQGSITFCKDEIGKKVDIHQFKFVLSEPPKKPISQMNKNNDKEKGTKWDEYNEALRDLKCNWLAKLGKCNFYKIYL